ncbi:hypothetical protein B0H14DRAFT_2564440 [Mycena olivaceomarginata]|nr:hypothetical protein B0H14DRAFT_2564440 [Mycena olivaceomarginata]
MPPRHVPTSRVLPGGALETTFQLDTAPPRTPPAARRRTRKRQPVGEDNTGAEPSPMRTRRRQYQQPPTPLEGLASRLQPELTRDSPSLTLNRRSQQPTTSGPAPVREIPVASSSRITLQEDSLAHDYVQMHDFPEIYLMLMSMPHPNADDGTSISQMMPSLSLFRPPLPPSHSQINLQLFQLHRAPPRSGGMPRTPPHHRTTPTHTQQSLPRPTPHATPTGTGTGRAAPSGPRRGNPPAGTQRKAPAGTRQPAAADVRTFFSEMETKNHCLFCQQLRVTHPHVKATAFSLNTSSGTMRKHLYERHADEWISGCDQLGIPITAKDAQPAVEKFRQRYGQQSGTGGTTSGAKGRRPFSHEAFVDALVEFIVGDDQSINVIENEHLRNLFLMLREDLRDSDIEYPARNVLARVHSRITFLSLAYFIGFFLIPLTHAIFHGIVPALAVALDLALAEAAGVPTVGVAGPVLGNEYCRRRSGRGGHRDDASQLSHQAQVGLRRDLSMVREFARNVEELKELQGTYQTLASEVQGILDMHALHPSKEEKDPACTSPTFFKRHCSNTSSSTDAPSPTIQQQSQQAYKQLTSAFYTINSKYRISWECAELLIELGGGGSSSSPPRTSTSAPAMQQSVGRIQISGTPGHHPVPRS